MPRKRRARAAPIWGLFGEPYVDLEPFLDLATLEAVDAEVARGLAGVETTYTGGTLKWMGVVAPWAMEDAYLDAMHAIEALPEDELRTFLSLSDGTAPLDPNDRALLRFGDETDHPFSREQERWLAYRHGVYFPWKVCYHLLENDRWEDKHSGAGKDFSAEAREVFPETVRLLESLPFSEIGRAVIFGLEPNDHAPLHRDTEPGEALTVAQSISLCPRRDKRFYLQNAETDEPLVISARAYWFNDMDYHGVLADPFFRYSIRVDGVFRPGFAEDVRDGLARQRAAAQRSARRGSPRRTPPT
jgi:Rieske 2Fe-2S family protein